jgi:thymidylate synthase
MALPPCHMFCQFYVHNPQARETGGKPGLSCIMYQRSADLGLGIPFNIASYALLTHIMARVTDTEPRELIIQLGDAHIYQDHVDALKKQLEREPRPFPKLEWLKEMNDIDDLQSSDFSLKDYDPWPSIPMKMSV